MASKQLGFGDYEQATANKHIRRERFLSREIENRISAQQLPVAIGFNVDGHHQDASLLRDNVVVESIFSTLRHDL